MRHTFIGKAAELFQSKRRRKRVQRTVAALSAVVVFVTTYMLILPAITMENQALICGMEEHVHTEDCCQTVLVCEEGQDGQETSGYICGKEEAEAHVHDDSCCGLTCGLEETEGHVHDDSCCEAEEVLTCDLEECDGHSHGDSCCDEAGELICGEEETDGHTHDESCYTQEEHLVCGQEECEAHTHDDSCFGLICGKEETEGHTHDDSCLPEQTEEETEPAEEHVHTEDCYQTVLVCGMEEHTHTEECYAPASEVNGGAAQPENPGITDTAFPQEIPEGYVEYNFDDEDGLSVTAYAPEDAFGGREVELVAQRLAKGSEDYAKAQQELDEADDVTYDGFAALDIRFEDGDGKEIEPEGTVYVRFNVQALLPADVDEDTLAVQHHGEETTKLLGIITTGAETYVQTVADSSDSTGEVIAQLAQEPMLALAADEPEPDGEETEPAQQPTVLMDVQAEFAVDSFSTFTITWSTGWSDTSVKVHYVDANGDDINGPQTSNVSFRNGDWVDLSKYATAISRYTYQNAHVDSYNGTIVTKVRANKEFWNSPYQYYYEGLDGTQTSWNNNSGEKHVYLVYESVPLGTIETVDTKSKGVTINLFDYMKDSINKGHKFKFGPEGDAAYNHWTGTNGGVTSGLVNKTLSGGYPTFTKKVEKGISLDYLFDPANNSDYTDLNKLFWLENGYYTYNSKTNFAKVDKNTKEFTVYDQAIDNGDAMADPKFLPFNEITDRSGYNYYFGMTAETQFIMPRNGQVDGNDMVFEFAGDDDVWVFVDDVLVLDLGGIHDSYEGTINFKTGVVSTEKDNHVGSNATSLSTLFKAAGKVWDGSDYSQHTFKFFYLERGAGGSNCKLKFNLTTVPANSLTVEKEVTTDSQDALTLLGNFAYEFQVVDAAGNCMIKEGDPYQLYEGKTLIGDRVVGENGIFTLTRNQSAVFTADGNGRYPFLMANATTEFFVRELLPNNYVSQYGDVQYTIKGVGGTSINGAVSDDFTSYTSGKLTGKDDSYVLFTNEIKTANLNKFYIEKKLAPGTKDKNKTFDMYITMDGQPLPVGTEYTIVGTNEVRTVAKEGIIPLKANEKALLINVVAGTVYAVEEELEDTTYTPAYTAKYRMTAPEGDWQTYSLTTNGGSVQGTILTPKSETLVTVTNSDGSPAADDLNITKQVQRTDGQPPKLETEYTFTIELDSAGIYDVQYANPVEGGLKHDDGKLKFTVNEETGKAVAEVKLYHGESVVIKELPALMKVQVREENTDGYAVSWAVDGGDAQRISSVMAEIGTDHNLLCTNTTGAVLPSTGGAGMAHIMPVGAALTLAAGALLLLKRRKEAHGAN